MLAREGVNDAIRGATHCKSSEDYLTHLIEAQDALCEMLLSAYTAYHFDICRRYASAILILLNEQ